MEGQAQASPGALILRPSAELWAVRCKNRPRLSPVSLPSASPRLLLPL